METFSETRFRGALDSADAMHRGERLACKPVLGLLTFEMLHEQRDLLSTDLLRKRHKYVGAAEIPVVFKDLILENQVIPESVPCQIRKDTVILMPVVTIMGKDDIRIELRLDLLEPILDRWPLAGKVAFVKRSYFDLFACDATQEILGTPIRFFRARSRRAKDNPADIQFRNLSTQLQEGSAGTDLNIV